MKKVIISLLTVMMICTFAICAYGSENEDREETLFQVNLLQSLTAGGYDGSISVAELSQYGDIGIGTFDGVNGEMIVLDGVVYQALYDGSVMIADDDETVPFATVTYMDADITEDVEIESMDQLKEYLNGIVEENGKNQFYMVRLDGSCSEVLVRSELKQEKPYRPLDEVLAEDQREFSYSGMNGSIIGLYCPSYMDGLNTPGWHFHFISDDRQSGGHMLDLSSFSGQLIIDKFSSFEMQCADTAEFNSFDLAEDQSERIEEVEQGK